MLGSTVADDQEANVNRRQFLILAGATALPATARAQQNTVPTIGFLHLGSPIPFARQASAFRRGLSEEGFVEGQSVRVEYRYADSRDERLPAMASELVGRSVDVIAAIGPAAAAAAKTATSTIPIVFLVGTDPVADGLTASLPRPGGNLTGVSMLSFDLAPKRLELILELIGQVGPIGMLTNGNNAYAEHMIGDMQQAARAKKVQVSVMKVSSDAEIEAAFSTLVQLQTRALIVDPEPFLTTRSERIVAFAARHAIPAIYGWSLSVRAGGLISYGPSLEAANHQVGIYVGRILKGETPANLPVQQPTRFELTINLKTAEALHLTVPQTLLAAADKVLE